MNSFLKPSEEFALCAAPQQAWAAFHGVAIRRLFESCLQSGRRRTQDFSLVQLPCHPCMNNILFDGGHAPRGRLILWRALEGRGFYSGTHCSFLNFLLHLSKVFGCSNVSILLRTVLS